MLVRERRRAAFRKLRGANRTAEDRAHVRGELDAIFEWKTDTLRARFRAELAAAMMRR